MKKKRQIVLLISVPLLIFIFKAKVFRFAEVTEKKEKTPAILETFSRMAALQGKGLSKRFLTMVELYSPLKLSSIIYGNKTYGYFETKEFVQADSKIKLSLIPPGYKERVEFIGVSEKGKRKLGVKNFNSKIPAAFNRLTIKKEGEFSFPFLIISGVYLPPKQEHSSKQRIAFNLIINRVGEVVFIHVPGDGEKRLSRYGIMKKVGEGRFAVLHGEDYSYFEIFNYKGEILHQLSPLEYNPPVVIHHDFIIEGDRVLFLTNKYASKRGYTEKTTLLEKVKQFTGPPLRYVTTSISEYSLVERKFKELFSFDTVLDPLENVDLNYQKLEGKSEFQSLSEGGVKEWGPKRGSQIDHTHANSLKSTFEGYIISLRNQNKIVHLDKDLKTVLWSVGHEEKDTYRVISNKAKFYRQHDARLTSEGNLVLFDNHSHPPAPRATDSRYLELILDKEKGEAVFSRHFTSQRNLYTATRGSSEPTLHDSILVYYPNAIPITELKKDKKDRVAAKDFAYEIDEKDFKIKGSMEFEYSFFLGGFKYFRYGAGSRAFPIDAIGLEKFVGYSYED